jgi:branched-subunit amino acid transport protein AzlD
VPDTSYIVAAIAIVAAITFAQRALPFAVLRTIQSSRLVENLNRWMPTGLVLILAIYSLQATSFLAAPYGIPEAVALAVTIALHLWRHNAVLSILVGTATYLVILNALLPSGAPT